jgi:serine/threonine-protein kinase
MMYEMLCGERPFKGDYEQAVIYSILNEEVKPLTGTRSEVSVEFERVVNKCLAKDPAKRYQHVDDLLVDLRQAADSLTSSVKSGKENGTTGSGKHSVFARVVGMAAVTVVAAILLVVVYPRFFGSSPEDSDAKVKKLAVLFFENVGPPDDEYFANGITDAITARLAVIHGLGVISRQSTIQYKGSEKSIHDIGDELGADYILEGTIQRERPGDPTSRVRIIPQLISVSDDIHLWADTYDEDMTEVFRVQSSIAERVARALNVTLLETERKELASTPTENLEAYEYYLRGNEYFHGRLGLETTRLSVEMYQRAIELDPEFAAAWAGLSKSYIWGYYSTYDRTSDQKTAAKTAVDKAGELDPGLPDVQIALGYYYYYGDRDFDRALEHFESALADRPNNVEILSPIAFTKRRQNKWNECAGILEKAVELNPHFVNSVLELGITYVFVRQYDKAGRLLDRVIFLTPENPVGRFVKILLFLLRDGDTERAKEVLMEASDVLNLAVLDQVVPTFVHVRTMPETYSELLGQVSQDEYFAEDTTWAYLTLAEMNFQLGQKERAHEYWNNVQDLLEPHYDEESSYKVKLRLGLAYAGLGRIEEAVRMTRDALADFPLSWDALEGTFVLEMAALTFVRAGEYEEATDQLELLLSVPSLTSRALFRIDPAWDPLRDNPRFQKLVEDQ